MKKRHHLGSICTPFYLPYTLYTFRVLYYLTAFFSLVVKKLAALCTLQILVEQLSDRAEIA